MKSQGKLKADVDHYKAHAEDGIHFLTDTNPAPEDNYYGFLVTGANTVITDITYRFPDLISGDITAITLLQGGYYPIPFKTITLSSGNMMLLKEGI